MTSSDPAESETAARKAALRQQILAARDALEIDDRLEWDPQIAERLLALRVFQPDLTVAAYWPMRSEADPRPIMEALHGRSIALCLPAIVERRMVFRRWAPYEPIVPGGFGTLVPRPKEPEVTPAILIVPLAAFDRRLCRIGYGKGYYDRAIAELKPVATVGIAYAAQEVAAVPDEPHDQPLDWIVTERETLSRR